MKNNRRIKMIFKRIVIIETFFGRCRIALQHKRKKKYKICVMKFQKHTQGNEKKNKNNYFLELDINYVP